MSSITLMIIDDDLQSMYLLERYAKRSGCRLVCTTSEENALALARQERPAAILLDLLLPGRSGWEVLQVLKADPVTCSIPIIVCSVLNEAERAQAAGAAVYLHMPIYYQDFLNALGEVGIKLPEEPKNW